MNARPYLLGCLALAACDAQYQAETAPVVVYFDQPFPADAPDLPGFRAQDQGSYLAAADTSRVFIIEKRRLAARYFEAFDWPGAWLDSAKIPRRAGSGWGPGGLRYQVQALAADSFRVRAEKVDTLLNLAGPRPAHLRRYQGQYYVSTPAYLDSTTWVVQRLALANGQLTWQMFNPDSLRVRALSPGTVQQHRLNGQLVLTLAPRSRQAIRQVGSYAGLWLTIPAGN